MPKEIDVREYEPGLGCPHCNWAGYVEGDRERHIRRSHAGEYSGPTEDMMAAKDAMKRGKKRGTQG
jgi:hypothetical protein